MREGREGIRSSQLDLFAWRERDDNSAETVGHGGWPCDTLQPNRTEPQDGAAERRLGDAYALGGAPKAEFLGDGAEGLQVAQLNLH